VSHYDQHFSLFTGLGEFKSCIPHSFRHRRTASCFEPKPTGPILNRISMLHDTEHWLVPVATKKGDCRVYAGYCFQSHR
ncbi:hypothetical protein OFB51_27390, partial [Escherichia coli]|nr:hypothetical protein [Escherichia coli]